MQRHNKKNKNEFQASYQNHLGKNATKLSDLTSSKASLQSLEQELAEAEKLLLLLPAQIEKAELDNKEYKEANSELTKINAQTSKLGLSLKNEEIDNSLLQKQIEGQLKEIEALEAATQKQKQEIETSTSKLKTLIKK